MTIEALVVSRNSGRAPVDAGGKSMVGNEMEPHAKELGMQAGGLYFHGRIGALGEVSSEVATATLGIFPRWVVDFMWRESAVLPAKAAVDAYRGCVCGLGAPLHAQHAAAGRSAAGRGCERFGRAATWFADL